MYKLTFLLLMIFCLMNYPSFSQIFPTQQDHDRRVDSLLTVVKKANEDTGKVQTLIALFEEIHYWDREVIQSPTYLKQAQAIAEKLNDQKGLADIYIRQSSLNTSDLEVSINYVKKALSIRQSKKDYAGITQCYNYMASIYAEHKDYSNAFSNLSKALDISIQSGDKVAIMNAYGASGFYFKNGKNPPSYPEALRYYLMNLKIATELDDKENIYQALNEIGLLYIYLQDFKQALQYFQKMKPQTGTGAPIGNLLVCYSALKDYKGGLVVLLDFKERHKNNNTRVSFAIGQAGTLYREMAEEESRNNGNIDSISNYLDSALANFNQSKNIAPEQKGKPYYSGGGYDYGMAYKIKASVLKKKGQPNETIQKTLSLSFTSFLEQIKDSLYFHYKFVKSDSYVYGGEVLAMQAEFLPSKEAAKKYAEALKYVDSGIEVATSLDDKEAIKEAYRVKRDIYKKNGQLENAYSASLSYDEITDSINADVTRKKTLQMSTINETIVGVTEEKARYDYLITNMRYNFQKKEDSLFFQQRLTDEILKQNQKDIQLKQAELALINNQNELNHLGYLKTQAELQTEQSKREEKEKALTIANQEKSLQLAMLNLQYSQIELKESEIKAQNKQGLFYIGGIVLLLLAFVLTYRNIKNRQKLDSLIASERLKSEKASAAQLMVELELQSLRAQLNPHFMFNSLNAIQELILKEDTDNAHLYLSRFSELLRMLLDNASQPFVSLDKEINLLKLYLSLENLRIPDLNYSIDIDPLIDATNVSIPNMILQPYIENAIWHGLMHKNGERNIHIRIKKQYNRIVCEIEDNGVGRQKAMELKSLYRKEHRSKGMELLTKRFELLSKEYGSSIDTNIEDLHSGDVALGTRVAITLPDLKYNQTRAV